MKPPPKLATPPSQRRAAFDKRNIIEVSVPDGIRVTSFRPKSGRRSNRKGQTDMAGIPTETLDSNIKDLASKVDALARDTSRDIKDLTVSDGKTRTAIGIAGSLIGLLLLAVLTLVGTGLYRAGELTNQVKTLEGRVDKIEGRMDQLEKKVDAGFKEVLDKLRPGGLTPATLPKP